MKKKGKEEGKEGRIREKEDWKEKMHRSKVMEFDTIYLMV